MRRETKVGNIVFNEGTRAATFKMPVHDALVELRLRFAGTLAVTVLATLYEDAPLTLAKQITIMRGGEKIKNIGLNSRVAAAGKVAHFMAQRLYGFLPELVAPAVGVGNNAFAFTTVIPFSLPPKISKGMMPGGKHGCALMPSDKDVEIDIDFGAVADVIATGTATLTGVTIEVIAVTDPNLNHLGRIVNGTRRPLFILCEHTKQIAIASGAGANTDFSDDIDRLGALMHVGIIGWDNSIRSDTAYNFLSLRVNSTDHRVEGSWGALQTAAKGEAGLQAAAFPVGINWLPLDADENATGVLDTVGGGVTSVKLHVDYDALTAANILAAHSYNLKPQI
jgi:hypothetical protein